MKAFAIILAAGRGDRFGADKVIAELGSRPVWKWSFDTYLAHPEISGVGVVASESNIEFIEADAADASFVILGGDTRPESVRQGLSAVPESFDVVLIHDGARPFVSSELITRTLRAIASTGAAAAAVPSVDTLRLRSEERSELLDRSKIFCMQTPQGGQREALASAYRDASEAYTDDVAYLEAAKRRVELVEGEANNFKITTPEDLARARASIGGVETRTGLGYDVHAFSSDESRPLWLGGIRFEDCPGLDGHSDADVLIHATVDALLGAAALGDIGQHFPPSDPQWKNEPSATFLKHAALLLKQAGWGIVNLDIAVIAERPRIMSRSAEMRSALAGSLGIDVDRVSVKATTNEGLGSIGRGEGIAALATATIRYLV